jgi:hypothetical protein
MLRTIKVVVLKVTTSIQKTYLLQIKLSTETIAIIIPYNMYIYFMCPAHENISISANFDT